MRVMRLSLAGAILALAAGAVGGCHLFGNDAENPPIVVNNNPPATEPAGTTTAPARTMPSAGGPAFTLPAGTLPGKAAVLDDSAVVRDPNKMYLILASYAVTEAGKAPANAQVAAKFLADHGVAVSIVMPAAGGKIATVASVQGFATAKEGEALRLKVVEIGKQFPAPAASAKAPFTDAYFRKIRK